MQNAKRGHRKWVFNPYPPPSSFHASPPAFSSGHVSSVKLLHSAVIVNVTLTILVLISHMHFKLNGYLPAYLTTLNTQVLL